MGALADSLRLFTLALGCLDVGLTFAVFNLYFEANRLNRIAKQQELGRFTGALPRHIIAVSLAHGLMIVALMGVIWSRLGDDFNVWPTLVALPAFSLSLLGQYEMLHFQRNRVDLAKGSIMVTGAPTNDRS